MPKSAPRHTVVYLGPFELNFRTLMPETETYVEVVGGKKKTTKIDVPEEVVLKFRYMRLSRSPEQDLVVGVERIVLRAPVLLVHERHMDRKWFVADSPSYFGDDSALRLLVDMIVANPEYRDDLGRLVRGLAAAP